MFLLSQGFVFAICLSSNVLLPYSELNPHLQYLRECRPTAPIKHRWYRDWLKSIYDILLLVPCDDDYILIAPTDKAKLFFLTPQTTNRYSFDTSWPHDSCSFFSCFFFQCCKIINICSRYCWFQQDWSQWKVFSLRSLKRKTETWMYPHTQNK